MSMSMSLSHSRIDSTLVRLVSSLSWFRLVSSLSWSGIYRNRYKSLLSLVLGQQLRVDV